MILERVILLVEDDPDDQELITLALKQNQITNEVVVTRNGVNALDYIFRKGIYSGNNNYKQPSIVFLDLKLPKIDGFEVLKQIRSDKRTEHLPVIVFTSSGEKKDIVKSYKNGANSYVKKPINFEQFRETIGQMGHYWIKINEQPLS